MPRVADGRDGLLSLGGQDLGRTSWRVIGQDMVDAFADVTGDHEWVHVDPVRAAAGPYGGTVAHGLLTLSLLPILIGELLEMTGVRVRVNYGLNRVRFPAPLPVGSAVRGHLVIDEATEVQDAIQLLVTMTVELEAGGKPACVAQLVTRAWV
jgi:acyl dehydratase